MTKQKWLLLLAIVLALVGLVVMAVGVNNLSKDCSQQTFNVVMINEELGFLKGSINGKEILPENGGDLANGSTKAVITTWYNATDNLIMPNYYLDTYGLCVFGLLLCGIAAAVYFASRRRKRYY